MWSTAPRIPCRPAKLLAIAAYKTWPTETPSWTGLCPDAWLPGLAGSWTEIHSIDRLLWREGSQTGRGLVRPLECGVS